MARKAQITIYTALKDAGFKKAEKGLKNLRFQANGLNSSLAKLGLGVGIAQFARTSVAAAVEMEQANSRLAVSLTNIGKAGMATSASVKASEKSMMALGFEGTQTAFALSSLVTATGSLEKSQGMLAASADLARFKNIDLASAAVVLAKASGGNAKAFKELGISLDKTLPPAKALEKAMGMLNAKIGGQAAAYATTYSGKLAILGAKFQDVQEQVGYKLLPVLVKLGDFLITTGIPKLETFFTMMKDNKDAILGMGAALMTVALAFKAIGTYATLAKVAALPIMGAAAPFIAAVAAIVGISALIASSPSGTPRGAPVGVGSPMGRGAASIGLQQQNNAKRAATVAPTTKTGLDPFRNFDHQKYQLAKETAAIAKKTAVSQLAAARALTAEKKLSAQFDTNQIALANALKLKLTESERAAIVGLIALQDDGYKTETQRMLDQEAALRKLITLRTDLASIPFYSPTLSGQEKQISTPLTAALAAGQDLGSASVPMLSTQPAMIPQSTMSSGMGATGRGEYAASSAPIVNLTVQGSVVTEQDLLNTIYEGLGNKLRAGATWYSNAASG